MPRGDGTGPMGMGPMTGRAAGFCTGYSVPGYANPGVGGFGMGFGRGRGRGFGRGLGRGFGRDMGYGRFYGWGPAAGYPYQAYPYPAPSKQDELSGLQNQAQILQQELEDINQRIQELKQQQEKE